MEYFRENSKYFRDIIQSFLNLVIFANMEYFSKHLKGYGIPGIPLQGLVDDLINLSIELVCSFYSCK